MISQKTMLNKILFLVLFTLSINCRRLHLGNGYADVQFIPLSSGKTVQFTADKENFEMSRTRFIGGVQYLHEISYNPKRSGIIYVQKGDQFYYDFISPEFPFIYFYKHEVAPDLKSTCPYAKFIKDKKHELELKGFDEIEDYYKGTRFNRESSSLYRKKNYRTHLFYRITLDSPDKLNVNLDLFTNNFREPYWINAGNLLKNMIVRLPDRSTYAGFYRSVIEKGFDIISDIYKESLGEESLTKWNTEMAKIKGGLGQTYEMVDKLVEDLQEHDELEKEKEYLEEAFSDKALSIFNAAKESFETLLKYHLSLPTALYFFANSFGENNDRKTSALKETQKAIERMSKNELTEKTFVNNVSLLNFKLLQLMFGDLNHIWKKNLEDYMNKIDWKLCWSFMDKIQTFYEGLPEYQENQNVLRGFDAKDWIFELLVQSHPYFSKFYLQFNEIIRPVLEDFYQRETEKIEKYKDLSGDSYDKGPAAFINEYYRVSLKTEHPNARKVRKSISGEQLFTVTKKSDMLI
jgi:hypothetical protein